MLKTLDKMPSVEKSYEYDKFSFFPENRIINPAKVAALAEEIHENDMTQFVPILVTGEYKIIDGQHRYEACRSINYPIYYLVLEITDEESLKSMNVLNSTQSSWGRKEWTHFYARQGVKAYMEVEEAIKHVNIPNISAAIRFATLGKFKQAYSGGNLNVRIGWRELADTFGSFVGHWPFLAKTSGITSFIWLLDQEKYNHEKDFSRLVIQKMSITECATTMQYKQMWAKYINKGRRKGNRILII